MYETHVFSREVFIEAHLAGNTSGDNDDLGTLESLVKLIGSVPSDLPKTHVQYPSHEIFKRKY